VEDDDAARGECTQPLHTGNAGAGGRVDSKKVQTPQGLYPAPSVRQNPPDGQPAAPALGNRTALPNDPTGRETAPRELSGSQKLRGYDFRCWLRFQEANARTSTAPREPRLGGRGMRKQR